LPAPQYQHLFAEENVSLKFTDDGLRAMAEKAKKTGTGARALRMIVESLLLELMFDIPSDPTIKEIIVDEECITSQKKPKVIRLQTS
ncbi:MAG: ATP-dependent Clp protease ATP-binding subunit ClpX, partial [Verrucomicrobiota bacterium]